MRAVSMSPLPCIGLGTSQPRLPLCMHLSDLWPIAQPSGSAPAVHTQFLLVPLVGWGLIPFSPPTVRLFTTDSVLAECRG